MQSVELTIRNDQAAMTAVSEALDRFAADHGIPVKCLIELQVVVDEIVSNVIKYAWPDDAGTHELSVRLSLDDATVEVVVSDDGQPYDPRNAPPPAPPPPGKRPLPGGVGIHMVKRLVDAFDYERADGYNRVKLLKRCGSDARSKTGGT